MLNQKQVYGQVTVKNYSLYHLLYLLNKTTRNMIFITAFMVLISFILNGLSLKSPKFVTSFYRSLNIIAILFMFLWVSFGALSRHLRHYTVPKNLLFLSLDMFIVTEIAVFCDRAIKFVKVNPIPTGIVAVISLTLSLYHFLKKETKDGQ